MQTIDEQDRKVFAEIGNNMFIEYTDEESAELTKIADVLRSISRAAQARYLRAS
jgi:hypothetical protein